MRFIGQTELYALSQQDSDLVIGPSHRPIFAQHTINTVTFLPSAGFEREIPAVKPRRKKAVDIMATSVGKKVINQINMEKKQ